MDYKSLMNFNVLELGPQSWKR